MISNDEILEQVKEFHRIHGRVPSCTDERYLNFGKTTATRRFGSWNKLIVAAGLQPRKTGAPRKEKPCASCGKPTLNPKFCNQSCAAHLNNQGKQHNKPLVRECRKCGLHYTVGSINTSKKLCEACSLKRREQIEAKKLITVGEYRKKLSVSGKHPSWVNVHVRSFNRQWNSSIALMPCYNCGYTKHVELAHIRPVSEFPDDTPLGVINDPSNVTPLCPNCHWEFDNGFLKIPSRVE